MEYLGYIMVSLLQSVDRYLVPYLVSLLISHLIAIINMINMIKEFFMHQGMFRDTFYQKSRPK